MRDTVLEQYLAKMGFLRDDYSNFYPELTTATVHGPVIRDDRTEYEFKTTIGTKG